MLLLIIPNVRCSAYEQWCTCNIARLLRTDRSSQKTKQAIRKFCADLGADLLESVPNDGS